MSKVFDGPCVCSVGERRHTHGQGTGLGRLVEAHRAPASQAEAASVPASGTHPPGSAQGPDRHSLRPQEWHSLGDAPPGDGMRVGHELLALPPRLAAGWGVAAAPRTPPRQTPGSRPDRLVSRRGRQCVGPGGGWGEKTGPNPTDRRKLGSKHHVITEAQGIPLATLLTGANAHDVTQLLPLVDAIPPIRGKPGRPRQKPDALQGDRGYDSEPHRRELRGRQITPVLAKRRTEHGSGLGVSRWVVERTLAWLHQFRRLRVRYERRPEIHEAFLSLGCSLICWNYLNRAGSFC